MNAPDNVIMEMNMDAQDSPNIPNKVVGAASSSAEPRVRSDFKETWIWQTLDMG